MKLNRLRIAILLSAAALLVGGVVVQQRIRAQHRRYVDQWVHERSHVNLQETPEQNAARIRDALLKDESNVIPLLLEDLRRSDSYMEVIWRWVQSNGLGRYARWLRGDNQAGTYRIQAAMALRLLGTHALPALPTLWENFDRITSRSGDGELTETALTLAVLAGQRSETLSRLGRLTNHGNPKIQLEGWVFIAVLNPSNSIARDEVRQRLMPAEESPIPALNTSYILGELGASGASMAPMVRMAVAKTYFSWPVPGLARAAHSLWKADGNPDLALQVFHRVWQEFIQQMPPGEQPADAGPGTDNSRNTVYQVAMVLGSIPEVAKEMRPLLLSMPTRDPEREVAIRCLGTVGREGEQPTVGAMKN